MQNLTEIEQEMVIVMLRADRQWTRANRIARARTMLKLAYKHEPSMIAVRKAVLRRLDYDYVDKVNASVR